MMCPAAMCPAPMCQQRYGTPVGTSHRPGCLAFRKKKYVRDGLKEKGLLSLLLGRGDFVATNLRQRLRDLQPGQHFCAATVPHGNPSPQSTQDRPKVSKAQSITSLGDDRQTYLVFTQLIVPIHIDLHVRVRACACVHVRAHMCSEAWQARSSHRCRWSINASAQLQSVTAPVDNYRPLQPRWTSCIQRYTSGYMSIMQSLYEII